MITVADLDQLFLAAITPPARKLMPYEFARKMRLPDGPQEGAYWDPATEPAQMHFINAISRPWHKVFVYVAPSQRGKTLTAILFPWLYAAVEEGVPIGYVMPNLDKLAQNWVGKIKPAIEGSGFGDWLPTSGPGSKSGKPAALKLMSPDGARSTVTYFMAGGGGSRETSLSSVSPGRLVVDEADDFESVGHIDLAMKRLESWGESGRAFVASTVNTRKKREGHPVLDMWGRADASHGRIAHCCPLCKRFQIIEEAQVDYEKAVVMCSACGVIWSEEERHAALNDSQLIEAGQSLKDGVIMGSPDPCRTFSLLTTGLDYHMGNVESIATSWKLAKEREALGDYSLIENFQQKIWCKKYEVPPDQQTVTDRLLLIRSANSFYPQGRCPDPVTRIVVAVDVQGDRIYWAAVGSDADDNRYLIDWGEWYFTNARTVEPTDADRAAVFDRVLHRTQDGWPREDGTPVRGSLVGIDIGYNVGGSVGRWCRGRAGVIALRGDSERRVHAELIDGKKTTVGFNRGSSQLESEHGFYEIRRQAAAADQPLFWWFVRTQSLREHFAGRIRVNLETAGAFHLPFGMSQEEPMIKHLSSWAIVRDKDTNICNWVQVGKRDDYQDCVCYALAMLTIEKKKRY